MNLFEKLRTRDAEISSLLARVLISADEEVRAIALLHEAIQQLPMDYSLLDVQASFCKSKGRGDLALECAKRSITAAPSEFGTWARLAEIYVYLEEWQLALLTLNSCPMFTYQDKDTPRIPEPGARVLLPVLPDSMLDEINDDAPGDVELVHPTLRKLHAASYKGTFLKAYSLLTEIAAKIGWDQLLKIRSQVFVMEEEYRSEKMGGSQEPHSRNSSMAMLRGTPNASVNGISNKEQQDSGPDSITNGDDGSVTPGMSTNETHAETEVNDTQSEKAIEKPEQSVTSEVAKSGSEDVGNPSLKLLLVLD